MKSVLVFVVCCVVSAQTSTIKAQQTNGLRVLPSNHESKRLPWGTASGKLAEPGWSKVKQPKPFDSIATNTPAFEAWAVPFMLEQANGIITKWKLQREKPLGTNDTTWYFYASRLGPCGSIATIDGRYVWSFHFGRVDLFQDEDYFARNVAYSDAEGDRLSKIKSNISEGAARNIAVAALEALGIDAKAAGLPSRPSVNQYRYEIGGKEYPLPLFLVQWKDHQQDDLPVIQMQVSGITDKVVSYSNHAPRAPRWTLPTNYFDMLGVKP